MGRPDGKDWQIGTGMRQDIDPTNAPPGSVADALNVRFSTVGGASPRPGATVLGAGTVNTNHTIQSAPEAAAGLFTIGSAGVLAIAGKLFAKPAAADTKFQFVGNYGTAKPVRRSTGLASPSTSYGLGKYGMAASTDGHTCIAAQRSSLTEIDTAILNSDGSKAYSQIYTGLTAGGAVVLAIGTAFVVLMQNGTAVNAVVYTKTAEVWNESAPTLIWTLNAATDKWDAAQDPASTARFWFVAQSAAAQAQVTRVAYPALTTSSTAFAVTGQPSYTVYCDGGNVWVGYNDNPAAVGAVSYRIYTTGTPPVLAFGPFVVGNSTMYGPLLIGPHASGIPNRATGVWGKFDTAGVFIASTFFAELTATGATSTNDPTWHVIPVSKPGANGRTWCKTFLNGLLTGGATVANTLQRHVLLRWRSLESAGVGGPPQVELATDNQITDLDLQSLGPTPGAQATGISSTFIPLIETTYGGGVTITRRMMVYEYATSLQDVSRSAAKLGAATIISGQPTEQFPIMGSRVSSADSAQLGAIPVGIAHAPSIRSVTQAAGGALTAAGVYQWRVVYEWADALGRRTRSAPSPPVTVTLTAGNTRVTLDISTLSADHRTGGLTGTPGQNPIIHVYRTTAGGSTFQRETNYATAPAAVSLATGVVPFVSTIADTVITNDNREFLYTDKGLLEFTLAPSCRQVKSADDAMWFFGLWDRRKIQKSRVMIPDEPTECSDSPAFQVYLPQDCNGGACQDGLTYAFCTSAVYVISGDGPNDQGVGNFNPVRALTTEFGSDNDTSILETSIGVIWKSQRGFMMIGRGGGNPQFIGAPVQKMITSTRTGGNDGYATCLGSCIVETSESRTARWLMSNGANANRVLVLDLDTLAWSYDTYPREISMIGQWPSGFAACMTDLSSATRAVYTESLTQGFDADPDSAPLAKTTGRIRLHPIKPWGISGAGVCQTAIVTMSDFISDATFTTVQVDVSLDANAATTRSWSVQANAVPIYRGVDPVASANCTAAEVTMTATRTQGRGPNFNGISLRLTSDGISRLLAQAER